MEQDLFPYCADTGFAIVRAAVVFAPHPDDEVFGCGGAILRLTQAGVPLRVVIVSGGGYSVAGEDPACVALRLEESIAAARVLGYGDPVCWYLPDRGVHYGEMLVAKLLDAIRDMDADLIFAPAPSELHPDHRAVAMAASEALRRLGGARRLACYEVSAPLLPNMLLDISDLEVRKREAMRCFGSQLAQQPYDERIAALNRYRAYTLGNQVKAAEAFFIASAAELANGCGPLFESALDRLRRQGLAVDAADVPLVSVIVRSMNRPLLAEALDSVARQTYPNLEVVVVNALGGEHGALPDHGERYLARLISTGAAMERGRAANTGLDAAQGRFLMFLDDDDLLLPDHVAKLVEALRTGSERAAYTGVKQIGMNGAQIKVLDEPWEPLRLRAANFLPIHAVLFDRSVLDEGCRFSEELECLEDWEFWLQISRFTGFRHVPGVSAIYRIGHGTSALSRDGDAAKHLANRASIFEKWLPRYSSHDWVQTFFWFENAREYFSNLAAEGFERARLLEASLAAAEQRLAEAEQRLAEARCEVERVRQEGATHAASLKQTIDILLHSTSWKITAPLRFVSRLLRGHYREAFAGFRSRFHAIGRTIYWRLPPRWRDLFVHQAYCYLPERLFRGINHYELWRLRSMGSKSSFSGKSFAGMLDIASVLPLSGAPSGTVAIHIHVFYPDLIPIFARFLGNMPFAYDLYVSVPTGEVHDVCRRDFAGLPRMGKLTVATVPNRGRDIAPMFCTFGSVLRDYAFIAHFHSKKSLYNQGASSGWLEYLLTSLLGSEQQVRKIFSLLEKAEGYGLVYPQNFSGMPYMANTWLANQFTGRSWGYRLGIEIVPSGYFDYPVGSMFWARGEALRPLFEAGIRLEDFPEEAGQTDGTLAHSVERLFSIVTSHSGFRTAILRDDGVPDWSRWRFGQYLGRRREAVEAMLTASDIRVVVFDIFDTLLVRPLLNPESLKIIIARRAGGNAGDLYLALRDESEAKARQRARKDVGLEEIFAEFALLSGLSSEAVAHVRRLEETIEQEAVTSRPDAVNLLRHALTAGKRVVLASDMYLPRPIVETMLTENGVDDYHALYLSSDIGLRKDTGELFHYILDREGVTSREVLMVGDNERSDFQIPCDLGMKFCHVLRPVELARALPRLGLEVEGCLRNKDLNAHLALGLIVRKNFSPLFFPDFDPDSLVAPNPHAIGYSVVGPLVMSFVQWLAETARADGVQRLYFLSREGQFLKMAYDLWATADGGKTPLAEYLVLSRRAVTVPMINHIEDIYAIASTRFFPNQVANFLHERYGLILGPDEWDEVWLKGAWQRDKLVEVRGGQIDHLKSLLQLLKDRILAQSSSERPGLMAYLDRMGLNNRDVKYAVVDIGYSATIQGRLNRLLKQAVHGYYLATDQRAEAVALQHDVIVRGCFAHYAIPGANAPAVLRESFTLEKLLSSDDAQIVRYQVGGEGEILSELRMLSEEEKQTRALRAIIRSGAMDFVRDVVAVRTMLFGEFAVPIELGASLYERFVGCPSDNEHAMLRELVLDDHYCGRGLVS